MRILEVLKKWVAFAPLAVVLTAAPVHAQRTEENVNTQSDDAFGKACR